jgi:SAM-dependent methyltransferase
VKNINNVAKYWKGHLDNNFCLSPGEELFFPGLLGIAKESSKILEIGVGRGRMVSILRKNGTDAEFYGADITENAKLSGTLAVIGDARKLPFPDNTFDLVYSLGVIEHFPETSSAVNEHARVVKNGGHVLITTPHLSVFTPLRYMLYLINEKKFGSFEEIRGRNIKLSVMKQYFMDSGLHVNDFGVYGMFGVWKILRKLKLHFVQNILQQNTAVGSYLYVMGVKKD